MSDWPKCDIQNCTADADYDCVLLGSEATFSGQLCSEHLKTTRAAIKPIKESVALMRAVSCGDIDEAFR